MIDAGTVQAAFRTLPTISPAGFLADGPVLVLAPHPDDETLGLGGLIAAGSARGCPIHVAVLTDGAGSHPRSRLFDAEALIALRKTESAEAAARCGLAPDRLHHFDLPDTQLPTAGDAFAALVDRTHALATAASARRLLVTWDKDPHCDHEAAAALARALRAREPSLDLWFYPIWGWHLPPDTRLDMPPPEGFRLDIAPWAERKRHAIAAHASQMTDLISDDPEGFRFTPDTLAPFLQPFEVVFRVP